MHDHHDHCGCGCGHDHHHESHHRPQGDLNEAQAAFLEELEHHHYLPLARFVVESSKEEDFSSVALAPVFLRHPGETMEWVKETGAMLLDLEARGLITLDYDCPLEGYSYGEYKTSDLYAYFQKTIAEAAARPGFLGDTPILELGSIAPVS